MTTQVLSMQLQVDGQAKAAAEVTQFGGAVSASMARTRESAASAKAAVDSMAASVAKAGSARVNEEQKTAAKILADQKKADAEREREEKRASAALLASMRQAEIAEAALIQNGTDRQLAIERVKHQHSLSDLKGNNAAIEAEIRRHIAASLAIEQNRPKPPAPAPTAARSFLGGISQGSGFSGGAAGIAGMAGAALGATIAITALTGAFNSSIAAANQMNAATKSLTFATGSVKEGAAEFAFLRSEADRLGVSLFNAAPQFASLAASARGTKLAGQGTREIFTGIGEAASALSLTGDQTAGALNAIQQMMSKGTVAAEELRGQLGERLPGAFGIAARSMGVSTAQLSKMLELGRVASEDFLPKFAAELHKTYGGAAVQASGDARASIQRFHDELSVGAAEAGEVAIKVYGFVAKALTGLIRQSSDAEKYQTQINLAQFAAVNPGILAQVDKETAANKAKAESLKEIAALQEDDARRYGAPSNATSAAVAEMDKADADAAKNAIELRKQLVRARIAATTEGIEQEKALAAADRDDAIAAANGYYQNELLARQIYHAKVLGIETREADRVAQAVQAANDTARARRLAAEDEELSRRGAQQAAWDAKAKAADTAAKAADAQIDAILREASLAGITDAHQREQAEAREHYARLRAIVDGYTLDDAKKAKARTAITNAEGEKQKAIERTVAQARIQAVAGMATNIISAADAMFANAKKNALLHKALAIAQIGVNTALAVSNAYYQVPYPLNIFAGITIGLLGAAQAYKASQAKYAAGGIVPGNSRSGDRVPAWVNSGEMILNSAQQARLFQIADGRRAPPAPASNQNSYEMQHVTNLYFYGDTKRETVLDALRSDRSAYAEFHRETAKMGYV